MKKFQVVVLLVLASAGAGCATTFRRSETVTPYGESVAEHRVTEFGDVVDVHKTTITSPAGVYGYGMPYGQQGGYGYGPGGIPYLQPPSLAESAMGQVPQGTTYVVPVPVQQQSTSPAQASETSADDVAIIAEHQLRMQRELDNLKKKQGSAP